MDLMYEYPEHKPADNNIVLTYCPDYTPLNYLICKVENGMFISHDEVDVSQYVEAWDFVDKMD